MMPLSYEGVVAEHRAVREAVGLFDVSHLGKILVRGAKAEAVLDGVLPGRVAGLEAGRAAYNLVLDDDAGILDDIFVYRHEEEFLIVPNAANFDVVFGALEEAAAGSAEVIDARRKWAILALSGPRALPTVEGWLPPGALELKLHRFGDYEVDGSPIRVARTGYTGEFTFEFFVDWDHAPGFFNRLLQAGEPHGIRPAGLGARDTLRLEMGYPLHGHDITPKTDPIEAGLEWVIRWDKPSFRGKERLEAKKAKGPSRRLVGLVALDRLIPREGYPIRRNGEDVGVVTSGNFSPTLSKGIALGYVKTEVADPSTQLIVDVRGRDLPMEVVKPPFVE